MHQDKRKPAPGAERSTPMPAQAARERVDPAKAAADLQLNCWVAACRMAVF